MVVTKKTVVVAPTLPPSAALTRFHSDATDSPLYTVATWTTRHGKGTGGAAAVRKRQLMIENVSHRLLELQRIGASKDKNRSWFIGNHVLQDGSLVVLTPMDPLFVLLHAVIEQKERYLSTYDLLSRDENVWWLQLGPTLTQSKIERICDVQDTGDDAIDNLYVRVNEAKVLDWLSTKVDRVATLLAMQAATEKASSAFDSKFVLPGQETVAEVAPSTASSITPAQVQKYHRDAVEVIADYLPTTIIPLLTKKLNITEAAVTSSVQAVVDPQDSIRRFDRRNEPTNDDSTPSKRSSTTGASSNSTKKKSKLANVDRTGMKSIASFFGNK